MAQIRFKGFAKGENIGLVSATVGADNDSVTISSFQLPSAVSGVPRLSDATEGDTMTVNVAGLSGITNYDFRIYGGASLQSGATATFDTTGQGGVFIECVVTHSGGTATSWPIRVHETMMATDVRASLSRVPHDQMTHVSVADGDWTNPATWNTGTVPKNGAVVLIAHDTDVTYDVNERFRLDKVRVDGTLRWPLDQSTKMLVEDITGARGSSIIIGTSSNRIPSAYQHDITISGQDYSAGSFVPTDLNSGDFLASKGWGRGLVSWGLCSMWGKRQTTWTTAEPVASGETSLTLREDPLGIEIGDTIYIGATTHDYEALGEWGRQDETRVLTGVSGRVLSWDDPLSFAHDNQKPDSDREDIYPTVMVVDGKNIRVTSEVISPSWQRGHMAIGGPYATADLWDMSSIEMGRTDKSIEAGVIDGNDEFERFAEAPTSAVITETLTSQSNLQGRYSLHVHMAGETVAEDKHRFDNCYVEGSNGWAIVHHRTKARMDNNAMYRVFGAGMVGEDGSETGVWNGNLCAKSTYDRTDINPIASPKNNEALGGGLGGDRGRFGYGFFSTSRAIRMHRNRAQSMPQAHVFYGRSGGLSDFAGVKGPVRDATTLQDATLPVNPQNEPDIDRQDFPILDWDQNEAFACGGAAFITKSGPGHDHDVMVNLTNMFAVGCIGGFGNEYIRGYRLADFDIIAGADQSGSVVSYDTGIAIQNNAYQVSIVNPRIEGYSTGILNQDGADTLDSNQNADNGGNSKWMNIAADFVDNGVNYNYGIVLGFGNAFDTTLATWQSVSVTDEDLDGTGYDINQDPSENFPLTVASYDGAGSYNANPPSNVDGQKTTTLSTTTDIANFWMGDRLFPPNETALNGYLTINGYYEYSSNDVAVLKMLISDPITARHHKITKLVTLTGTATIGKTNNGALTYSATPVTASGFTRTVAIDGSDTFNLITLSSASGGNGSFVIDDGDWFPPKHGTIDVTHATGSVTYTADAGYEGYDSFTVFVESAGQYRAVRVDILVGAGGSLTTPVVDTHFAATDATEAATIDVKLELPRPSAGGRLVRSVYYSTDAGSTWRRLCNGWIPATHKITVESDGTAISNSSYNLRIKYSTQDGQESSASADDAVTVT